MRKNNKEERVKTFFRIFSHLLCSSLGLIMSLFAFLGLLTSHGNANVNIWLFMLSLATSIACMIIFGIYFISAWNDTFFEQNEK